MIVAGFGFRGAATKASLQAAFQATGVADVDALATPEDKAQAQAFRALAKELALPVITIAATALENAETLTRSEVSQTHRGTGSVAEACALAAAGPQAELVTHRMVSPDRMATCAIAKGHGR
ncbi:cobalamin biosynthesis protein [Shimia sp.]|uniref:cobalamin biosynthesis protein n=1 Tax=Shimia sp. TaxID=1954381 RepID=UPI00356435BA